MTEYDFWDNRYRLGGKSGKGSIGDYRKWKWKIIGKYVDIKKKTVLDVGCGDLSFMKGKKPLAYTGFDISPFIIEQNRQKRPDWSFLLVDGCVHRGIYDFDVVLAMDILFHVMDDRRFANLLRNLNNWTSEWLFVNTWSKNPLPYLHDDYQYFRDLKEWLPDLPDLELVAEHQKKGDEYNTVYVFRRKV